MGVRGGGIVPARRQAHPPLSTGPTFNRSGSGQLCGLAAATEVGTLAGRPPPPRRALGGHRHATGPLGPKHVASCPRTPGRRGVVVVVVASRPGGPLPVLRGVPCHAMPHGREHVDMSCLPGYACGGRQLSQDASRSSPSSRDQGADRGSEGLDKPR